MDYVRASARLVLDNANADGRITVWGLGCDWEAREPRLAGRTSAESGSGWSWQYQGEHEFIEPLQAIAPLGQVVPVAMSLDDWTLTQGTWGLSSASNTDWIPYLYFYDGRPGLFALDEFGRVTSNASLPLALRFGVYRFAPHPEETDPCLFQVRFGGDFIIPEYALTFPLQQRGETDQRWTVPVLSGRVSGQNWVHIDEYQRGGRGTVYEYPVGPVTWQSIRVEYDAGWLLVTLDDTGTWAYRGPWRDELGNTIEFEMKPGPIQVQVIGHTAMFAVCPLAYPASATIRPTEAIVAGANTNINPTYHAITHEPTGTDVSVAVGGSGSTTWPEVTFTTSDSTQRALLYCVQEFRPATIADDVSNPIDTFDDPTLRVVELRGSLNDRWRGATCEATIRASEGAIPALKSNAKISVDIYTEALAEEPEEPPEGWEPWDDMTAVRHFTGYAQPFDKELSDGIDHITATLRAADGIEARLAHKRLVWHSSYDGWLVEEAFNHILNRCGVPATMIDVDEGITETLPLSATPGDRRFKPRVDDRPIDLLDSMALALGLEWGVDVNGHYFLRPPRVYDPDVDVPDIVLTAEGADPEDTIRAVRLEKSVAAFYNILYVLAGQGGEQTGVLLTDAGSLADPDDLAFIGDDWWHVEARPDVTDAQAVADELWRKREEEQFVLFWRTQHHPELLPGNHVQLDIVGLDVPEGSIFRITEKRWQLNVRTLRYEQELAGVLVHAPEEPEEE